MKKRWMVGGVGFVVLVAVAVILVGCTTSQTFAVSDLVNGTGAVLSLLVGMGLLKGITLVMLGATVDLSALATLIQEIGKKDKALAMQGLQWIENIIKAQEGPPPAALTGGQPAAQSDEYSGLDYEVLPSALSDEHKAKLMDGLADGTAINYLKKLVQGIAIGAQLAGGGILIFVVTFIAVFAGGCAQIDQESAITAHQDYVAACDNQTRTLANIGHAVNHANGKNRLRAGDPPNSVIDNVTHIDMDIERILVAHADSNRAADYSLFWMKSQRDPLYVLFKMFRSAKPAAPTTQPATPAEELPAAKPDSPGT